MKFKIKKGQLIGIGFVFLGVVFAVINRDQSTNIKSYAQHLKILHANHIQSITLNTSEKKLIVRLNESIAKDKNFSLENHSSYTVFINDVENSLQDILENDDENSISIFTTSGSFPIWLLYLFSIIASIIFFYYWFKSKNKKKEEKTSAFELISDSELTFDDIAGLSQAKAELVEIVDFLKDSSRYAKLGAKLPSGILLSGEPGTGKTLLAKAIAGEAKISFIPISGADFVEVYVGIGSSRIRDLFKMAKENSPCIIFIDEIDALGRSRGAGGIGSSGTQERENTLNSFLVEMDGFTGKEGIIVIGATNRVDILDKALIRAGRFDRIIYTNKPDFESRKLIFNLHLSKLIVDPSIDLDKLAELTSGASGADIFNICNEAALLAGRIKNDSVNIDNLFEALERQQGGINAGKILSKVDKRIISIHEAGHAICSYNLENTADVVKVSIIPKGGGLGYTQYKEKDKVLYSFEEILDQMVVSFGGRVAEELILGYVTNAAQVDLEKITFLARKIVNEFGMSKKLVNQYFGQMQNQQMSIFFSDDTLDLLDKEIQYIVNLAYRKAKDLLSKNRDILVAFSNKLFEEEEINFNEMKEFVEKNK